LKTQSRPKQKLELAKEEVEAALLKLSRGQKPQKWLAENYIGAGVSNLSFLDTKIPLVRKRFSEGFSFSEEAYDEQWLIWNSIWQNSAIFEVMLLASYWAASRPLDELIERSALVFGWVDKVDNWAHSDEMSSLCSKILESSHKKFLPVFETWARSSNPWHRRQSLVGLLFYARFRKKYLPFSTIKRFIEDHLNDSHFYVQKGVGWTLRECWNVYPDKTEAFLKKIAHRIPPAGWTAATEKLKPSVKRQLTSLRRSR